MWCFAFLVALASLRAVYGMDVLPFQEILGNRLKEELHNRIILAKHLAPG